MLRWLQANLFRNSSAERSQMPAKSKKQKAFMDAAAHNPAFAKKAGVPTSVAKDFSESSKGIKFGGPKTRPDLQKVNEPKTRQGKTELFSKGGDMKDSKAMMKKEVSFMKKAGAPKSMIKHEKAEMGMKKMASGGMAMVMKDGKKVPAFAADGEGKMKHGGAVKKMASGGMTGSLAKHASMPASKAHKGLKSGGAVDGIATKGKTRGKMC